MRPLLPILAAAAIFTASASHAVPDPRIQAAVATITDTEVQGTVEDLVAFGTRYSGTAGNVAAADSLRDKLAALGYTVQEQSFPWGARTLRNVSATLAGCKRPGEIWLVLGHYDSTSENPNVSAPGADDDASAIAVVLAAARVLKGMELEASVRFLCTGGEEQGMLGSAADVQRALGAGENIAGVINIDMVGYWPTGWARSLDADGDFASGWLADAYGLVAADYEPAMNVQVRHDWGVCDDDQVSYSNAGYPAIILMNCYEAHLGINGETVPHYHRTTDLPSTCDFPRLAQVARATTAALAHLAVPVDRRLWRNDGLASRTWPGAILRAGMTPVIDPAHPATTVECNPAGPKIRAGEGEPVGPGMPGVVVFYETDLAETLLVARSDADADGAQDVVLSWR